MTWLSIPLALLSGFARYVKGASLSEIHWKQYIPTIALIVTIAVSTGTVAFIATHTLSLAVVAGINAGVCVLAGCTKWESLQWQSIRGGFFGLSLVFLLTQFFSMPEYPSLILLLYTLAYVNYTAGYHCAARWKAKHPSEIPPFHVVYWERISRVIQGVSISSSSLFL